MAKRCLGVALLVMIAIAAAQPAGAGDDRALEPVALVSATGTHEISVEIAATDAARARGLMFRRALAPDRGMLFLYDGAEIISMWMRNTYIPLDMVFVRPDGRIQNIVRDTEPFSEEVISSTGPVSAVLEIAAGRAEHYGLKPGDEVRHRHFGNVR